MDSELEIRMDFEDRLDELINLTDAQFEAAELALEDAIDIEYELMASAKAYREGKDLQGH